MVYNTNKCFIVPKNLVFVLFELKRWLSIFSLSVKELTVCDDFILDFSDMMMIH